MECIERGQISRRVAKPQRSSRIARSVRCSVGSGVGRSSPTSLPRRPVHHDQGSQRPPRRAVADTGSGRLFGLTDITEEHYDTTFDDNVKGLVFIVQKAVPLLPEGASIVLMSSTAGSPTAH